MSRPPKQTKKKHAQRPSAAARNFRPEERPEESYKRKLPLFTMICQPKKEKKLKQSFKKIQTISFQRKSQREPLLYPGRSASGSRLWNFIAPGVRQAQSCDAGRPAARCDGGMSFGTPSLLVWHFFGTSFWPFEKPIFCVFGRSSLVCGCFCLLEVTSLWFWVCF